MTKSQENLLKISGTRGVGYSTTTANLLTLILSRSSETTVSTNTPRDATTLSTTSKMELHSTMATTADSLTSSDTTTSPALLQLDESLQQWQELMRNFSRPKPRSTLFLSGMSTTGKVVFFSCLAIAVFVVGVCVVLDIFYLVVRRVRNSSNGVTEQENNLPENSHKLQIKPADDSYNHLFDI